MYESVQEVANSNRDDESLVLAVILLPTLWTVTSVTYQRYPMFYNASAIKTSTTCQRIGRYTLSLDPSNIGISGIFSAGFSGMLAGW